MSLVPAVAQLGSIMGIWAHPDDETFMSGGLMATALKQGQRVACITATRGEAGLQDQKWANVDMGETRMRELEAALKCLGEIEHNWLTYEDGRCHQITDEDALQAILPIVKKFRPDTIVTFPPDGLTGHFDHQAASRWAALAAKQCDWPVRLLFAVDTLEQYQEFTKAADEKFNIYFNVSHPALVPKEKADLKLDLSLDITRQKIASLKAMPSQTGGMFSDKGDEWFEKAFCCEVFVNADRQDVAWNTEFLEVPATV